MAIFQVMGFSAHDVTLAVRGTCMYLQSGITLLQSGQTTDGKKKSPYDYC